MGSKVITTKETPVTIDGRDLGVERLTWSDGGVSFDVTLKAGDKEILLTMNGSFDSFPTEEDLRTLLEPENLADAYKDNAIGNGEVG